MSFFTRDELRSLGLASVGDHVQIDRRVTFFNPRYITIAERSRIDCFAIVSAGTEGLIIGSNVHVAAGSYIFGGGGKVTLEDFSGLSSRVCVYTSTDDYLEGALTNPTVPMEYRDVTSGSVYIGPHVIVGTGSVLLPGVRLEFGAAVGALTVVRENVDEGTIVVGNPARAIPNKRRDLAKLRQLESAYQNTL